jgi:Ca2+/Na+ antiporter
MHDKAEHYPQDNGADYYTASPQQQYRDTTPKRLQSAMTKFLITLTVVFMPYIGFFLIIFKRPYSKKASMVAITYCILLSVFVFINMGKSFERVSESNSNVPEVGSVEPIMPTINQPTPQPTREAVPTPTPTPIPTQTPKKDTLYDVQLWYEGMKPEVAHTFEINFADMYSASITNVRIAETKLYFSSDFGCFFEVYFKCTYDGKKCEGFAWAFLEYLDDKITWWCIEVDYGWDALIEDFNDYYDDYVEDYYNELVRQYG